MTPVPATKLPPGYSTSHDHTSCQGRRAQHNLVSPEAERALALISHASELAYCNDCQSARNNLHVQCGDDAAMRDTCSHRIGLKAVNVGTVGFALVSKYSNRIVVSTGEHLVEVKICESQAVQNNTEAMRHVQ